MDYSRARPLLMAKRCLLDFFPTLARKNNVEEYEFQAVDLGRAGMLLSESNMNYILAAEYTSELQAQEDALM